MDYVTISYTTTGQLDADHPLVAIHSVAVSSLVISIIVSIIALIYAIRNDHAKSFWKKKMSDRLVVYLAVCDLLYSTTHLGDHSIALHTGELPYGVLCETFGFLLSTFGSVQSLIILQTAVSAFFLMVRERRLSYGKYDWRLLFTSIGPPCLMGFVVAGFGMYGRSEVWCMADKSQKWGVITDLLYSAVLMVVFLVCVVCYGGVWWKIKSISRIIAEMSQHDGHAHKSKQQKNNRAAKVMSFFVLAYLLQWSPFIIYACWSFVTTPSYVYLCVTTFLVNMGGVFNFFAYTFARRKSVNSSGRQSALPLSPLTNSSTSN